MAYVSRAYMREKWNAMKSDMEDILLEGGGDKIPDEDVERCRANVVDKCLSIVAELTKDSGGTVDA